MGQFKDAFNQTLKSCDIDSDTLETLAQDRIIWKTTLKDWVERAEETGKVIEVDLRKRSIPHHWCF